MHSCVRCAFRVNQIRKSVGIGMFRRRLAVSHLRERDGLAGDSHLKNPPNLGHLLYRLRNAVAHRLMTFSSDSLDLNEVVITFRDRAISQARYHREATQAAGWVRPWECVWA